ncbi:Cocaine esterase [Serratia ficaria]|nr:Cocaine esterase [Serratia ficaria]CAI1218809.1 Cocaine esterase [Serratia ficaria]CAI2018944.1 Cocaine esterase [Serratia ficaria]CAI2526528.1 Cocaine esterase [Serratia ficaria]CAI2531376.1 Cocaine esterase [Serratia ficaria]
MLQKLPMRVYGNDAYPTWFRRPLPLDAPRVRYPGFNPGSETLRQGTVRRKGAMPLPCDILLERDVAVTLRDGTVIYTDVFRPVGSGAYPTILAWSPYGKQIGGQWLDEIPHRFGVTLDMTSEMMKWEGPDPAFWVNAGYAVIHPDIRGAYRSGGNLVGWGRQTAEDGCDVIAWVAQQAWSNGKVGMAGNSWLTVSQWFIAAEQPPQLAAIAPWEGASDIARDDLLRGGIPRTAFPETLIQSFAGENLMEDMPRMAATEQDETPYWADKAARLERIEVPVYIVASYDNIAHTHGTFDAWKRISSKEKWLRVHNTQEWPDFYDPANQAELKRFFDRYLKGEDNGWEQTPQVRISILDPGRQDEIGRVVEAFPPAGYEHVRLHLADRSSMSFDPASAEGVASYEVDGGSVTFMLPIDYEAELIGYSKLRLFVEADGADDMDLSIRLEKVDSAGHQIIRATYPGGAAPTQMTGYLRVSRRALDRTRSSEADPFLLLQGEQRLSPGEIVPVDIGIWPMAMKFHPGEQLKLTLAPFRNDPMNMPFGLAAIDVPKDSFTFQPGTAPEMIHLAGGGPATMPVWAKSQEVMPPSRNRGIHRIHFGGAHDSYLLVPLKRL